MVQPSRQPPSPLVWHMLIAALGVVSQGCGGEDWQAATYPASGKLTVNGQPAAGAVVELHSTGPQPDERNSRPWAITQPDGSFKMSTYELGDGAPLGAYAVTLRWPPDVTQPSMADQLGGAYATAAGSRWNVTITEGENQLAPIVIEGVKLQSKPSSAQSRSAPPAPPMGKDLNAR